MHQSSLDKMQAFCDAHLADRAGAPLRILDIGSQDVNGSYRPMFARPGWTYVGADLAPGPNVDVVLPSPYAWSGLASASFDVVISGQAFEHIEFFWLTMLEVARVLRPGGLCCILVPAAGFQHRYPLDCWRFFPDGLRALARWARLEVLEARTQWLPFGYEDGSDLWRDSLLVARKPRRGPLGALRDRAARRALRLVARAAVPAGGPIIEDEAPSEAVDPVDPAALEDHLDTPLRDVLARMQRRIVGGASYFGVPTQKNPLDLWVYQELLFEQRPDVIVEIGNFAGGSALALAHLCDQLAHGRVIGVDISHARVPEQVRDHPRIKLIEADACEAFEAVRAEIGADETTLVIEDSSHTYDNTLAVLRRYAPLVPVGGYLIVEDSICHHGLELGPQPGPYEAIDAFLREHPEFTVDRGREAYLITWNPRGFLRRVR